MTKTSILLIVGFFILVGIDHQGRGTAFAQNAQSSAGSSAELLAQAQAAEKAGQHEQAIALYHQYLSLRPDDDVARTALALVLAYNSQFADATAVYKDILTRYPHDLDVQIALARVYSWQKQYAAAQRVYEQVLQESPSYTDAKQGLADTLFWNGEDTAALRLYEEVHAAAPTDELAQRIALIKTRIATLTSQPSEITQTVRNSVDEEDSSASRDHVSIGYSHFRYSNSISDERIWQFQAVKHIGGQTFVGQIESIDRFGKHDTVFSGEIYSSFWNKAWGDLAFSFSPNPQFSSQWTLGGDISQGLGVLHPLLQRLELSCGYRHMSFASTQVDLLSPGITIYLPYSVWLTEQVYMVPKTGSRSLASHLDWQPADRWLTFISGSFGQSVERPTAAQDIAKVNTLRLAGGLKFPLTRRITGEISYQYEDREKRYSREGGALNLTYSW